MGLAELGEPLLPPSYRASCRTSRLPVPLGQRPDANDDTGVMIALW